MAFAPPRAAVVGLALAALLAPSCSCLAAPDEFRSLQARVLDDVSAGRLRSAVPLARARAALPGLSVSQRVEALLGEAELLETIGDADGNRQILEAALTVKPGDPGVSLLLAQALRDRPEQALAYAEQAARSAESRRQRAAAERLAGEIRLDLDDKAGARVSLERALQAGGEDLDALRAMAWLQRDEPGQAAVYSLRARRAAAAAPAWQRGAAERQCARIQLELKDYSGALASLRRALDLDPDDLKALQAMLQIRRERPEEPAFPSDAAKGEAPERSLAAEPDELETLRALVELERGRKRPAEASEAADRFTAAVRRAPAWLQVDAYRMDARLWLELGDAEKALKSRQSAEVVGREFLAGFPDIEGHPLMPAILAESYTAAALARIGLGDVSGAEAAFKRGLERLPESLPLLRSLAKLELSLRKLDEALPHARRLVAAAEKESLLDVLQRQPPNLLVEKAAAAEGQAVEKRTRLFLSDAATAERLGTTLEEDRSQALQTLAAVLFALGRPTEALACFDRLIKASARAGASRQAEAHDLKARMQRDLKDAAGARRSLERALSILPGYAPALRDLAQLTFDEEHREEAEAGARRHAPPPDSAPALQARIQLEIAQGRNDEALASVERLAKASETAPLPQRVDVLRQKAHLQGLLHDEAGARTSLESALALAPDDVPALQALAEVQLAQGRPQDALETLERLDQATEKAVQKAAAAARADVYRLKARVQRELKDEAGARRSLERALALAREDFDRIEVK